MYRIQVTNGNILQHVLQSIERSSQGKLPPIASKDRIVDLLEKNCRRCGRSQSLGSIVYGQGERNGKLDNLIEEDGGRGEVTMVTGGWHYARVMHDLKQRWQSPSGSGDIAYQNEG